MQEVRYLKVNVYLKIFTDFFCLTTKSQILSTIREVASGEYINTPERPASNLASSLITSWN